MAKTGSRSLIEKLEDLRKEKGMFEFSISNIQ